MQAPGWFGVEWSALVWFIDVNLFIHRSLSTAFFLSSALFVGNENSFPSQYRVRWRFFDISRMESGFGQEGGMVGWFYLFFFVRFMIR